MLEFGRVATFMYVRGNDQGIEQSGTSSLTFEVVGMSGTETPNVKVRRGPICGCESCTESIPTTTAAWNGSVVTVMSNLSTCRGVVMVAIASTTEGANFSSPYVAIGTIFMLKDTAAEQILAVGKNDRITLEGAGFISTVWFHKAKQFVKQNILTKLYI